MSPAGLVIRAATRSDLPAVVRMLADDELGSQRERYEDPLPRAYHVAFDEIDRDPNNELIVAELNREVLATLQLTFLPSISFQGGLRAQVESVRVDAGHRNQGIGNELMKWTIERARERGAHVLQLSTHKSRDAAHRFYKRLGFQDTHIAMKLRLK